MMRLIKMECYRLIHTVSAYVMIVVVAGITVMMAFALKWDLEMMEQEQKMRTGRTRTEADTPAGSFASGFADGWASESEESGGQTDEAVPTVDHAAGMVTVGNEDMSYSFGITSEADESWIDSDIGVGDMLLSEIQSCMILLFIAIFVPLFVNAEQKKGYIKNIAGQIPRREMLALSKLPAVAVQVCLIFIVFCITHAAASGIILRDRLVFHIDGALLRVLVVQLLIHVSWGCLIAMFTMAARSTAFAMVTGIFLATGISQMIGSYMNRGIHAIIPAAEKFDVRHYMLTYAAGSASAESTVRQIGSLLAVAAVYVVVSAVVSGTIYRKRDIG